MTIEIQELIEGRRGCGYRKPGGIYLVGPPDGWACCKFPFPLTVCPTCGAGIHVSRGWTWVEPGELFQPPDCQAHDRKLWAGATLRPCPLADPKTMGRAGLLWVGEKFYKSPGDFLQEARDQGISRRISVVPRGFKPGKTWVLLAHRKGYAIGGNLETNQSNWLPAIFAVFRPRAIEYVVKGDETDEELERLAGRGLTPVRVLNRVAQ